jgi:hypothetical protein
MRKSLLTVAGFSLVVAFVLSLPTPGMAQGRGRGGGGGGGRGVGGPPSGVGVDRGIGTASDRSNGRSDKGLSTASARSSGRSDEGINHARMRQDNARRADDELHDHPEMAANLHTTANDLRDGYHAALATNPDLKFGQYVAATRLAANLGATHLNITRDAILAGLASGKSLGRTLQDLGLSSSEARDAKDKVEREIKVAKQRRS